MRRVLGDLTGAVILLIAVIGICNAGMIVGYVFAEYLKTISSDVLCGVASVTSVPLAIFVAIWAVNTVWSFACGVSGLIRGR